MKKSDKMYYMAKNNKQKNNRESSNNNSYSMSKLKTETIHSIWAILFFVLALFLLMSIFDIAGVAGQFIYEILNYLLGIGYILLPLLFILLGSSFLKSETPNVGLTRALSGTMFLLSSLGIIDVVSLEHRGGFLGRILSTPLVSLFDVYASIIFLGALLLISIVVMFDVKLNIILTFKNLWASISRKKEQPVSTLNEKEENMIDKNPASEKATKEVEEQSSTVEKIKKALDIKHGQEEEEEMPIRKRKGGLVSTYVPPPLSLLEEDQGKPNTGDIKANANIIKRTLANFGIEVEMDEITVGPTVTRYALKPAEGVKLSRIVGLQNDLALSLAAHPIRIEAPIPGKSLVGIEIPNKSKSIVGLATLLSDSKFQNSPKPLTIALGRGISGKAMFGNLAKMPHALVAGTTGSGKSVTIHSIITSLLYRNGPDDLKLILIDPKRVELTLYNNIPHLLTPVITEAKKTILALKWAAKEMDRRYDILEAESVRDIESYHTNVFGKNPKKTKTGEDGTKTEVDADRLPYIVIIIDELADIMSSYPRELESAIVRLAQMSRAVGIHLILSTQRPEVNVITGLIKANIPARVALKVSSQIDSRTILDAGGAEKLLGAGDMLYSSGEAQPERLQSAFISETEVKKVVKYLVDAYKDELTDEISLTSGSISADKSIFESTLDDKDDDEDEMYEEARQCVIEAGKASTSYLQRKLKLGYARAARLMDTLQERGVISAGDGAKPREVLEKIEHTESGENIVN
ncbi:MAG: translocase FtsK/SpoIIIE protein [Candidatus Nomurabacteria bacterium GW2011_GWE1_32_28]|uniref:Translocase FtsK/SpoIIIE protein n=1 Tax=Candidatus Nomurabacteria bacterium GW2011_GWF1_31_48 TaxID=1618767 RepID=A0A0G0ATQ5_9BACT|nr:MAG: translocase FtsK/SpoIIIE protein [Candidatus Nomurabacteria bacterium GW2011_GWF2_30_133]KKP28455.1 MAG: translocase FtsK/SpoIIIE protein [Candidatus Nomurabacteria bacterium GW2011_GWE2_31_40]KKP30035.1 MAG: translocase FtsK/SpoIIIE protein [Candidatus Nomurabacteria bacterium GW2011_GWF1_31_48]KKP34554.1 MAG: translocase FtsK/SpoIIIE protein [Candidatus Nomurabacteria bacterium GW2011_GWE1_32_28]HAS81048.1 cell division protein FtsK [Candidatus Nomurabacteria bacterium]